MTRCPGSATTLLRMWERADKGTGEVDVPCGSCNACCRAPSIKVELSPEETARFGGISGQFWNAAGVQTFHPTSRTSITSPKKMTALASS